MLFRSTGKAKKGTCMFIRDKLYKKARNFLYMGIEPSDDNPMIVELSAYAPLVSSGIVGRIKINPKNIISKNGGNTVETIDDSNNIKEETIAEEEDK
jgi:hypothetical protein